MNVLKCEHGCMLTLQATTASGLSCDVCKTDLGSGAAWCCNGQSDDGAGMKHDYDVCTGCAGLAVKEHDAALSVKRLIALEKGEKASARGRDTLDGDFSSGTLARVEGQAGTVITVATLLQVGSNLAERVGVRFVVTEDRYTYEPW